MAGRLGASPDVGLRRERLRTLGQALPEAVVEPAGVGHLAFKVRKKIFAYYTYDHHGDGRITLMCKAPPGEQARLVEEKPSRFFVPGYVGSRGWVGYWLDGPSVDWRAVRNLMVVAYALTVPPSLRKGSPEPGRTPRKSRGQTGKGKSGK